MSPPGALPRPGPLLRTPERGLDRLRAWGGLQQLASDRTAVEWRGSLLFGRQEAEKLADELRHKLHRAEEAAHAAERAAADAQAKLAAALNGSEDQLERLRKQLQAAQAAAKAAEAERDAALRKMRKELEAALAAQRAAEDRAAAAAAELARQEELHNRSPRPTPCEPPAAPWERRWALASPRG
jgi:hypothetical protein